MEETMEQAIEVTATEPAAAVVPAEIQAEPRGKKEKKAKKPKNKKRTKLIIWLIVLLVVGGYIGYSMWAVSNYIPAVRAGSISYQQIDAFLSSSATISSSDSESYFAPSRGKVKEVNFKLGDRVKKGDVIATFDLSDLNSDIKLAQIAVSDANIALEKAEAGVYQQEDTDAITAQIADLQETISSLQYSLNRARREQNLDSDEDWTEETIERYQRRMEDNGQTIAELQAQLQAMPKTDDVLRSVDSAKNNVSTANIKLQELQKDLGKTQIVAETDGVISALNLVEGAPASSSSAAVTVQSTDNLVASFNIGKYDLGAIQVGQSAVLTLGNLRYEGVISKIGAAAVQKTTGTSTTTTVPAEITINNPDDSLVVGLEFDVDIHTFSNPSALSIPVEALLTDSSGDFCYKLVPSEQEGVYAYEKTYITVGNSSDMYAEVLGGIDENAQIVLNPPTTIEMLPIVKIAPDGTALPSAVSESSEESVTEAQPASEGGDASAPASASSAE